MENHRLGGREEREGWASGPAGWLGIESGNINLLLPTPGTVKSSTENPSPPSAKKGK